MLAAWNVTALVKSSQVTLVNFKLTGVSCFLLFSWKYQDESKLAFILLSIGWGRTFPNIS